MTTDLEPRRPGTRPARRTEGHRGEVQPLALALEARRVTVAVASRWLEEIELQAIGPEAYIAPNFKEFRARMNLDPDQVEAINGLVKRCSEELLRVTTPPPDHDSYTREQRRAHWDATQNEAARLRESTTKAIDKVLSMEQREAYTRMLGEPFDFPSTRSKPIAKAK